MEKTKKYYTDFNVIRNISCIAVFLYHLGLLKGGFLAVCIFFVMSGYLSCMSLFKKKKVSFKDYYKERFMHIYLPLIMVVLSSVFILSVLPNIHWLNLKPETTSVLFGYNNFWQLNANLDYFARHISSPFMHFWYIAILLQFELIFPFLFVGFQKLGDKKKSIPIVLLSLLTIVSTGYFVYASINFNIMSVYYHTLSRIFSLFMGVLLGFIHNTYQKDIFKILQGEKISRVIFYLYLGITITSFFFIDSNSKIYVISMILVSIITCRLLSYGSLKEGNKDSFWNKLMKYFSSISYEIYLFQYPIIYIFESFLLKDIIRIPSILLITVLLSILLHYAFQKKKVFSTILLVIFSLLSLGGLVQYVISEDHTEEMKMLEEELSKNQEIMNDKQKEYALRMKEQEDAWNNAFEEVDTDEEKVRERIHNLPVIGIGDSVMLGAINRLYETFPNGFFDAAVSRTDYEANSIINGLKSNGTLGDPIIFALGTNGQCGESCRSVIYNNCEGRKIFWVNVTNDWSVHVNSGLAAFADEHPNVYLIDWNSASAGHSEYFVADQIHLTYSGRIAYAETIYNALYDVYYNEAIERKNNLIKEREEALSKKYLFYGSELLLNAYQVIQTTFDSYELEFHNKSSFKEMIEDLDSIKDNIAAPKNVVFVFDKNMDITDEELSELQKYTEYYQISVVFLDKNNYSNKTINILDFSKKLLTHPDYIMIDNIHLSDKGNKALAKFIYQNTTK